MTDIVRANVRLATPSARTQEELDELLQAWLQTLTDETTRTYRADLEYFAAWLEADNLAVAMQTLFNLRGPAANGLVLRYRRHLQTVEVEHRGEVRTGYAPATINRRLAALRSVAKIARITGVFEGQLEISGVPHAPVVDSSGIGAPAYHRIMRRLDSIERTKMKPRRRWELVRDRAILRMLHDQALRRVEVVRVCIEDLDLEAEDPAVIIRPKGHKGSRTPVLLSARVVETLRSWIAVRGSHPGALFHSHRPGEQGNHLSLSTINRICARRGQQAKLARRCTPHGLRHTAITTGLDMTGDIRRVAQLARHKNPSTTMRYDDRSKRVARDISDLIGKEEK